jgi:hypothetical protein
MKYLVALSAAVLLLTAPSISKGADCNKIDYQTLCKSDDSSTWHSKSTGPLEGLFFWRNLMPKWRNEYRRSNCRREYRPEREAQSYCSRRCKRAAAYGRERFRAGTKGRRLKRLEASDKLPGRIVAGSVRNEAFSSTEPVPYRHRPTASKKLNQAVANDIDRAYWSGEKRNWPIDLIGGARHSARQSMPTIDP